jgi:Tol biopolymer transport system component
MVMTKLLKVTAVVLGLMLAASLAVAQESGYDLYQKALVKERAVGDVEEALHLYQRVTREFAGNHALAAKAQYRLGLLYDRLGRHAEAQRAFNAVVSQYPDQTDLVREARAKLVTARARPSNSTSEKSKPPATMGVRRVWEGKQVDTEGSPSPDGELLSFTDWVTGDLAVRELDSGKSRHLTDKGPWTKSVEFAEDSVISPDGKQIVYTWFDKDYLFGLRVIGIDGSNARVLYRDNKVDWIHAYEWTKDGKQLLVYMTYHDLTSQIGLISVADGRLRVIETLDLWRAPARMSISPDEQYIVFDARQKRGAPEHDLYLLAVQDGRESPLITHPAQEEVFGWTPDGKRVLFASDRTGVNSLWSVRVAAGKALQAPELIRPDLGRGFAMGFARDGSLYIGLVSAMRDVYVATLDPATGAASSSPKELSTRYVGSNTGEAWSPDGKSLAYVSTRGVSQRSQTRVLVIRSVETDVEREITPALSFFRPPQWSPDSRSFIVAGMDTKGVGGIYRIDAQTGETTPVVQVAQGLGTSIIQQVTWSRDGKSIYYVVRAKNDRVLVHDLETGQEREIFRADAQVMGLALSSDGRQLAFFPTYSGSAGARVIKIISSSGEPVREIALNNIPLAAGFATLAWTPDGRYLVFGTSPTLNQKSEVWRVPVEGGSFQNVGISMDLLADLRMNPDGKRIAFTAGEFKSEVWVLEHFLTPEPNGVAKRRLSHRKP